MTKNNALLICIAWCALLCVCGGGSDIGNPDIKGRVCDVSGTPVINCMVVLGPERGDPGKADTFTINGGFITILQSMSFDTVTTGKNGEYIFTGIPPGKYSIVASRDNLLGLCRVDHEPNFDSYTAIKLTFPAKLVLDNYSQPMDTSVYSFKAARISGTNIESNKNVRDRIYFEAVPAGVVDVVLYRDSLQNEIITDLELSPNESLVVRMDPRLNSKDWTYMRLTGRDPLARPFILSSSPEKGDTGIDAMVNVESDYDAEIQFSHAMDTKSMFPALTVFSSDSTLTIDSLWWIGSNVLRIKLCNLKVGDNCLDDNLYVKKGVTYSIAIDTIACSTLGVHVGWPDTISFTPVP